MKRRAVSARIKSEILSQQHGTCFYCNQEIGSAVYFRKKVRVLRATIDHVIPFAYCQHDHSDNFVVACQVCNSMKHSKIFNSMADCLEYIQDKWLKDNGGIISCQKQKQKSIKPVKSAKQPSKLKELGKYFALKPVETNGIIEKPSIQPVPIVVIPLQQVKSIAQVEKLTKRERKFRALFQELLESYG